MKQKTLMILAFMLVHITIITLILLCPVYFEYPYEQGRIPRNMEVRRMYSEISQYKEDNGQYPLSIDSFWIFDPNEQEGYFGSNCVFSFKNGQVIYSGVLMVIEYSDKSLEFYKEKFESYKERFEYKIVDEVGVLIDLGYDKKEGGVDENFDVAYPNKHTNLSIYDFTKTQAFRQGLVQGLVMAVLITLSLYGMWKGLFRSKKITWKLLIPMTIFSIVFLAFTCFVAHFILLIHVYPHH